MTPCVIHDVNMFHPITWVFIKVSQGSKPGRPIVSLIKGPLERIGRYVDGFIKTMVTSLPSYVQDTCDVLAKLQDLGVPPGALLVGIDVESLYSLIPHE